jgi:hypothetical protein
LSELARRHFLNVNAIVFPPASGSVSGNAWFGKAVQNFWVIRTPIPPSSSASSL